MSGEQAEGGAPSAPSADTAIRDLLGKIRSEGIKVWESGGALKLTIPEGKSLSDEQRSALKASKAEVLTILHGEAWGETATQKQRAKATMLVAMARYAAAYFPPKRCTCLPCVEERERALGVPRDVPRSAFIAAVEDANAAIRAEDAAALDAALERIQHATDAISQR